MRAALKIHLIFSTLHTNNAVSAAGRLMDMGVEPFLLSSVLEGILAQRLGRKICQHCKVPQPLAEHLKHRLSHQEMSLFVDGNGYRGAGCEKCDGHGTRGRVGFFELVMMTPTVRQLVAKRATSAEIQSALGAAWITMRKDGLIKAASGETMLDEVLRATQDASDEIGGHDGGVKG